MIYRASGRYVGGAPVDEPRSAPLRCFKADISTVGRHPSTWGAWTWSRYAGESAHLAQCRTANGIVILHKLGTRWYVYWEGSSGYPPTHKKRSGGTTYQGVPRRVTKDLEAGLR